MSFVHGPPSPLLFLLRLQSNSNNVGRVDPRQPIRREADDVLRADVSVYEPRLVHLDQPEQLVSEQTERVEGKQTTKYLDKT